MWKNWYVAGLLAGTLAFFTGAFAHMVLGLGDSSMQKMPDEASALAGLSAKVTQPGLYAFPYEMDPEKTAAAWKTNPHGLLIYAPAGGTFSMGTNLGIQLITDLSIGLIMAWLFVRLRPAGWMDGAAYGVVLGVLIALASFVPYWNWYSFPAGFTGAALLEAVLVMGLAGCLLGWLMRPGVPVPVVKAARA